MTYGSYNPGSRYRQRSQKRVMGSIIAVCTFFLSFAFGFWIGSLNVDQAAYVLRAEKDSLEKQYASLQAEITQVRSEAQTANVRMEQLKASYNEVLSEGPLQDILMLVKKQVDAGVDPKRIETVILSARPPKNCSDPKSRRLLIVTPNYKGPESRISLESGTISIWGEGSSAKDTKNTLEAWFDPSKPVKILFQPKGGVVSHKEGVLPIYYSMIAGDREYRFTIAPDAKSFAKITYDMCDYP